MTGYGSGRAEDAAGSATVQVAVVNHRHCQVQVRCEPRDVALENHLRSRTRDRIRRGSATVQMQFAAVSSLGFDRRALAGAWRELAGLADELGAPVPSLERVAALQQRGPMVDIDGIRPLVDTALDHALDGLETMRGREGEALRTEFLGGIVMLEDLRERMGTVAARRLDDYRERLLVRVGEALGDRAEVTPADLVREVALHADRIDVREELVRLDSHLDQLRAEVENDKAAARGKKIEFLLQELGREINTCGSKANDAELTALVCEAKHAAEQLREQVANVL